MKKLELKFYEKIGIKKFRHCLIKLLYFTSIPFMTIFKIPKEERKNRFYNSPSNYFMKKGNGLKDLKDFKKWLYFNTGIHVYAIIPCISGIFAGAYLIAIPFLIINLYCIMLQRYNYIRIDNIIKKYEEFEKKKINTIKEEIKETIEDSNVSIYNYRKNKCEKNKTIDDILDNLSLKSLKELKNSIEKRQFYYSTILNKYIKENTKTYRIKAKIKQKS